MSGRSLFGGFTYRFNVIGYEHTWLVDKGDGRSIPYSSKNIAEANANYYRHLGHTNVIVTEQATPIVVETQI